MKTKFLSIPHPLVSFYYSPSKDVLLVEWPDFDKHLETETTTLLNHIADTLKTFHIKYLLLDRRNSGIDLPEHQYRSMMLRLLQDLKRTGVKKLASVVPADALLVPLIKELAEDSLLLVPVHDFHQVEDAVKWLASKKK